VLKENTSKENKRTWRIGPWYSPVFSLYAGPHKLETTVFRQLFNQYKKVESLVLLSMKGGMVEKTISSYFSFNLGSSLSVLNGGIAAACHRQLVGYTVMYACAKQERRGFSLLPCSCIPCHLVTDIRTGGNG
jgi:hypothetical protein